MNAVEQAALQLAEALRVLANDKFYLEAATDNEIRFAVLSILCDICNAFDELIPAGTAMPYLREK